MLRTVPGTELAVERVFPLASGAAFLTLLEGHKKRKKGLSV